MSAATTYASARLFFSIVRILTVADYYDRQLGARHESEPLRPRFPLDKRVSTPPSPPSYPSPWMNPKAIGWEEAYAMAKDFVSQMTLMEKVNITTGVG